MQDVACKICVRNKDAQKQLARTSLIYKDAVINFCSKQVHIFFAASIFFVTFIKRHLVFVQIKKKKTVEFKRQYFRE